MKCLGCTLFVMLAGFWGQSLAAQETSRYELSKRGGFSPYAAVSYTVRVSEGLGTVIVRKVLPGSYGEDERATLVYGEALSAVIDKLGTCRAAVKAKPSTRARKPVASAWTLVVERGGMKKTVAFADPELELESPHQACLKTLREIATAQVGAMLFRDVFFEKGTFGYLQVSSEPVANVIIDGIDTGQASPLIGIPLSVGEHEVIFEDRERGVKRRYSVKVMPEMTTNLSVDLR